MDPQPLSFIRAIISKIELGEPFSIEKDASCWGYNFKSAQPSSLMATLTGIFTSLFWGSPPSTEISSQQFLKEHLTKMLTSGIESNRFSKKEITLFEKLSKALRNSDAQEIALQVDAIKKQLQKSTRANQTLSLQEAPLAQEPPLAIERKEDTGGVKETELKETEFVEDLGDLFAQKKKSSKETAKKPPKTKTRPSQKLASTQNDELTLPIGEKPAWASAIESSQPDVKISYGGGRFFVRVSTEVCQNLLGTRLHDPSAHQLSVELIQKVVEKYADRAYRKLQRMYKGSEKESTISYRFCSEQVQRDNDRKEVKRGNRSFGSIVFRLFYAKEGQAENFIILTCYQTDQKTFENSLPNGLEAWLKESPPIELYCQPLYLKPNQRA